MFCCIVSGGVAGRGGATNGAARPSGGQYPGAGTRVGPAQQRANSGLHGGSQQGPRDDGRGTTVELGSETRDQGLGFDFVGFGVCLRSGIFVLCAGVTLAVPCGTDGSGVQEPS